MNIVQEYKLNSEEELDALTARLTNMFEDRWWFKCVEYRVKRLKWWHLFPHKVPTRAIVEFDV